MKKNNLIIALITLSFSLGLLAQPVLAAKCVRMIECMPAHKECHLPSAADGHSCSCLQTNLNLISSFFLPSKRYLLVPAAKPYANIGLDIPSGYANQLIYMDMPYGSCSKTSHSDPVPQNATFILNLTLLC